VEDGEEDPQLEISEPLRASFRAHYG
jgi:hypothetical protein